MAYFKLKSGDVVNTKEMFKAAKIIWGKTPDFFMFWTEIRDRIGAVEISAKQAYDYALSKEDEELAVEAYKALRWGDVSDTTAKIHVKKALIRKINKKIKSFEKELDYNGDCTLTGMYLAWHLNFQKGKKEYLEKEIEELRKGEKS